MPLRAASHLNTSGTGGSMVDADAEMLRLTRGMLSVRTPPVMGGAPDRAVSRIARGQGFHGGSHASVSAAPPSVRDDRQERLTHRKRLARFSTILRTGEEPLGGYA
jgi:hypothetical protein